MLGQTLARQARWNRLVPIARGNVGLGRAERRHVGSSETIVELRGWREA